MSQVFIGKGKILGIVVVLCVVAGLVWYTRGDTPVDQLANIPNQGTGLIAESESGNIKLLSIEQIGRRYLISFETPGNYLFEGSLGVEVVSGSGIKKIIPSTTVGTEWMTTEPVRSVVEILVADLPGGLDTIIIKQSDPSGEAQNLDILVADIGPSVGQGIQIRDEEIEPDTLAQ